VPRRSAKLVERVHELVRVDRRQGQRLARTLRRSSGVPGAYRQVLSSGSFARDYFLLPIGLTIGLRFSAAISGAHVRCTAT
jgi:hypothetical protein